MDLMKEIRLKSITIEDFVNYKKPSMFLAFPHCNFKCGRFVCQNSELDEAPILTFTVQQIVNWYIDNSITKAFVFGGLEPFDDYGDLLNLVDEIRKVTDDDIVIYTGYYEHEIREALRQLSHYKNILVKFGRYVPDKSPAYDINLGVTLASNNQYSKWISEVAFSKISLNPNKEEVNEIQAAIRANDGYCPCKLLKNEDTKCMCKQFRVETQPGEYCDCGLFFKNKI